MITFLQAPPDAFAVAPHPGIGQQLECPALLDPKRFRSECSARIHQHTAKKKKQKQISRGSPPPRNRLARVIAECYSQPISQ